MPETRTRVEEITGGKNNHFHDSGSLWNPGSGAGCPDFLRGVKPAMHKAALRRMPALHPYGSRGTIKTLEDLRVSLLIAEFIGDLL